MGTQVNIKFLCRSLNGLYKITQFSFIENELYNSLRCNILFSRIGQHDIQGTTDLKWSHSVIQLVITLRHDWTIKHLMRDLIQHQLVRNQKYNRPKFDKPGFSKFITRSKFANVLTKTYTCYIKLVYVNWRFTVLISTNANGFISTFSKNFDYSTNKC